MITLYKEFFSISIRKTLLDHQNNTGSIKKDYSKLDSYFNTILNQFNEKIKEVGNLKKIILSITVSAL
ncbi:blasticidin-S acetyltransferase [Borreliella burgdorferi]|uniref:CRASP family complement regulator-acquiring lipoprotein n=1 Tax=Borreliella burgdorferi TaxID=139 RepID=UPI0009B69863|nr:blasticidin-S acetyltransferase [Borreliella burgdorferi]PRR41562.1 blasticidin-S acetyltransferase [Borreliella burgdorferi]PRR63190.1 blasticidin-S acetyltransferase [Borreliella burgdorferi]PRR66700.1 blasticidin-S acetyltransferase [Borreliella burgdorferi]